MKRFQTIDIIFVGLFVLFVIAFTFTSGTEFTQDLGRHIKLGELIAHSRNIPHTNLFSYTNPSFQFINHHWLAELIYYVLFSLGGALALNILKTSLIIGAILAVVESSAIHASILSSVTSATIISFLLIERSEMRPELFGWLFFALLLNLLNRNIRPRTLYIIPLILLLSVNMHITFIFGCFLSTLIIGLYIHKHSYKLDRHSIAVIVLCFSALILNPNGIKGALYPFIIFGNYGYTIVENQNLLFLNSLMDNPTIRIFFFLHPLIIISAITLLFHRKYKEVFVAVPFYILSWYQIRHMPFFALSFIPILATFFSIIGVHFQKRKQLLGGAQLSMMFVLIALIIFFATNTYWLTYDMNRQFGYGFVESGKGAAEYVLKHNLQKNIFNTFDIGGYAIYKMFPEYLVFVDNRPEAYPSAFMTDTYIALQQDVSLRKKIFKQHNIHTILMNHTDQTPWAESFITSMLSDPQWKAVYMDTYGLVMTDITDTQNNNIMNDDEYLSHIIFNTSNSIDLMQFARIMSLAGKQELAIVAFRKASQVNPLSCSIHKSEYAQLINSPMFDKALAIKSQYWYCF